jgi:type I restriction enzyme M protein
MIIQDFSSKSVNVTDKDILNSLNSALESSLVLYQKNLGKPVDKKLRIKGNSVRELCRVLCRINLLESFPQVMQDFYMYFARHIYKVDLAQYFTPYEVVDFIVRITNPKFGDRVKDPACGSADFLVAAYRIAKERHGVEIADQVYGTDSGIRAVQISVLNMILNGDGKSNVIQEDSLSEIERHDNEYTLLLCNPPFGKDILEKRPTVLAQFELSRHADTHVPFAEQETGILFVEVCVRSARPGQRIAIILPNGYLGNRSERYVALRRWLLRQVRVAAVIGFPRFTFKKSGADVSASVVIMEKLDKPVGNPLDTANYPIHFNLINKVGWDVRNKRAEKLYLLSEANGSPILDENNDPIIDSDFDRALSDLYSSPVIDAFPWMVSGVANTGVNDGWAVPASEVLAESAMILDPKRWSQKYQRLVSDIKARENFRLGDVLEFASSKFKKSTAAMYRYVEIGQIYESFGAYDWDDYRGWNLPGRAKHKAKAGDIFVAHIWSSAGKWFMAGGDADAGDLIVTSGCYHLRLIEGMANYLPDLVFGFSTEAFRVQMRALATGSDGLSVVSENDLMAIVLPKLTDQATRADLSARIEKWTAAGMSIARLVHSHIETALPDLDVPARPTHAAQV